MEIKSQKGFTLIEVLISLLILAFSMTVLMQSWGGSLRGIKKSRNYTTVAMLLQKKITEFELVNRNKSVDEISEASHGDFGHDYPDYTWDIKTQPFSMPNIFPPPKNGQDNAMTQTIVKTLEEYFSKTVREISVTVNFKSGKRTQHFSVTTLYVDYKKDLPLGF